MGLLKMCLSIFKLKPFIIFAGSFLKTTLYYWTSGSDLGSEGEFYWDSMGEFFGPFTDWEDGQPNNAGDGQHCVNIECYTEYTLWNDGNCRDMLRYICEMKIVK